MKLATLTMLLIAAGCAGEGDPPAATASTATSATTTTPEVRVPLLPGGGDTALVGAMGVLEVEGPCLYLRAADGSRTLPLFAVEDVRWTAGTLVVRGRTFRPGQSVMLGGTPVDGLPQGAPWVQAPDPRCSAARSFIAHQIQ